jgi:hypothetical protein
MGEGLIQSSARTCRTVVAIAVLLSALPVEAQQPPAGSEQCRAAGRLVRIPELQEASGVTASRRVSGRLWAHNDSGEPVLFALDANGSVSGRTTIAGAKVEDWEALASGACPAGSCLFVGDIGDNGAERDAITIYRVNEPEQVKDATAAADVFHAAYPDGAHDAETLLVAGDGRLFVVTKGETGPVALYAFPRELRAGDRVRLERVGGPRPGGKPAPDDRITDGSVSGDGQWVALRTRAGVTLHRSADLFAGNWKEARRIDLRGLGEPQGEGVAFGPGSVLYLLGEGGGKSQPGTFARFTCTPGG